MFILFYNLLSLKMKNMELSNMIFVYKMKDWYLSYVQLE